MKHCIIILCVGVGIISFATRAERQKIVIEKHGHGETHSYEEKHESMTKLFGIHCNTKECKKDGDACTCHYLGRGCAPWEKICTKEYPHESKTQGTCKKVKLEPSAFERVSGWFDFKTPEKQDWTCEYQAKQAPAQEACNGKRDGAHCRLNYHGMIHTGKCLRGSCTDLVPGHEEFL